jgi:hypothetical protein
VFRHPTAELSDRTRCLAPRDAIVAEQRLWGCAGFATAVFERGVTRVDFRQPRPFATSTPATCSWTFFDRISPRFRRRSPRLSMIPLNFSRPADLRLVPDST